MSGYRGEPEWASARQQPQYGYGQRQQYPHQQQYGNGQQQAYGSSMPQARLYQQQFSQQQQRPAAQHSSTPNPRPTKRMRAADGAVQQPQQQQYHQQRQYQPPQQQQWQQQPQQYQQQQYMQQPAPPQRAQPQQQLQQQRQQQPQQRPGRSNTQQNNSSNSSSAAVPRPHPRSTNSNPAVAAWLDGLQEEILRFTQQVVPSPEEQQARDACVSAFADIASQALPEYAHMLKVSLFGSGAAGLALHMSDLDVVVAGLASPDATTGHFDEYAKQLVVACLRRLERAAMYGPGRQQLGVTSSRLIARARIPVLKLVLRCGLELDVSFNDDGGIKAAVFLKSFQNDYKALQPLTLLLKCVLKQRNLSEVYLGGLGSWSLVNMAIAHLMEEDKVGGEVDHLGAMLLSFLQRYGASFDRQRQAVAVRKGGIVAKADLGPSFGKNGILALEDPLTGREVAGGSHRYADVEDTFDRLHERLSDALVAARQQQQERSSSGGSKATEQQQQQRRGGGSSSGHILFDDDGEEWGYDAGNRSPTYKATIRRSKSNGSNGSNNYFDLLELLLDCREALQRPESETPAASAGSAGAGRQGHGVGGGSGGQWQWGNGGSKDGAAAGGSRKRNRCD